MKLLVTDPPLPEIPRGTISIHFVREALVNVRARGYDVEAMLHQAGISPDLLALENARITATTYGALWRAIAQETNDEFFGMDSHGMRSGSFTILCHSVLHCGTLGRGLSRMLRFFSLILDDFCGKLERDGDLARIVVLDAGQPQRLFAYGTFLLILHGLSCWLIKRRIPMKSAYFRASVPAEMDEYRVLFSTNIRFGCPTTALTFDASFLDLPAVQTEPAMKQFLREAPANFLVKYKNSDSIAARIRRRIRQLPPSEWPDFDQLACAMGLSSSTLRRRLDEEGHAYQAVKDELRRDMAIAFLGNPSLSVSDIAACVGFSETSAFHRAFRKWTGANPGQYRLGNSAPDTGVEGRGG
jgi:AraC-like DNA-binding protein